MKTSPDEESAAGPDGLPGPQGSVVAPTRRREPAWLALVLLAALAWASLPFWRAPAPPLNEGFINAERGQNLFLADAMLAGRLEPDANARFTKRLGAPASVDNCRLISPVRR